MNSLTWLLEIVGDVMTLPVKTSGGSSSTHDPFVKAMDLRPAGIHRP